MFYTLFFYNYRKHYKYKIFYGLWQAKDIIMVNTWLTHKLSIKYPIIQGAMGPYSTNKLAAAVANAGGLGIISMIGMGVQHSSATPVDPTIVFGEGTTQDYIQKSLSFVESETRSSQGIFGINCPVSAEFMDAAKMLILGAIQVREQSEDLKKRLKVIITSAGDPVPWGPEIRKTDLTWFHVIPSIYHARRAEKAGVDAIIASGHEGGAHISWQPVHSMVLIPGVIEQTSLPVIAAGGICDGRTMAAALTMGAVGIQMGTRFIATAECDFWDVWKQGVIKSDDRSTLVGRGMFGPMRFIANPASTKLVEKTVEKTPDFFKGKPVDLVPEIVDLEKKGFSLLVDNDENGALILGGEAAGRISDLPPVSDLMENITLHAKQYIQNVQSVLA
ncbi:MAG: enoyl-[acyl carrier protein] reductase II [Candidatus Magnetoglobus multicellularis str. Araruama]|uniref:Enoyl-[acyl carrier protein] reductase II n=1 Tax=Candidatus Magnetoglobus multicellularis str. Araruama TaxID=890399 RepID=A0A1V1PAE0_9BACT|nr:MAG: enoyl-[acyl carrier protein] reductase II [Candidatus Magnetoglobus multicellularis str. Araruama]